MKPKLASLDDSILTYAPPVIVYPNDAVAKILNTYRIKRTRDWLDKPNPAISAGAFQSTETTVLYSLATITVRKIVITGEHTVLAMDDARNQIALDISICDPLLVDNALRRRCKVIPHLIERVLYRHHLVKGNRRAGITLHTTLPLAFRQIATELLCKDVRRDKDIAYLKDM